MLGLSDRGVTETYDTGSVLAVSFNKHLNFRIGQCKWPNSLRATAKLCVRQSQQQKKLWRKVAGFMKYSSWCTGIAM